MMYDDGEDNVDADVDVVEFILDDRDLRTLDLIVTIAIVFDDFDFFFIVQNQTKIFE